MAKHNAHPKPGWFLAGAAMAMLAGACLLMDFSSDEAIKIPFTIAVFIGASSPVVVAREGKRSYLFGFILGGLLTMMFIGRDQPYRPREGGFPPPPEMQR